MSDCRHCGDPAARGSTLCWGHQKRAQRGTVPMDAPKVVKGLPLNEALVLAAVELGTVDADSGEPWTRAKERLRWAARAWGKANRCTPGPPEASASLAELVAQALELCDTNAEDDQAWMVGVQCLLWTAEAYTRGLAEGVR